MGDAAAGVFDLFGSVVGGLARPLANLGDRPFPFSRFLARVPLGEGSSDGHFSSSRRIQFTHAAQNQARASFQVKFTATEIGGGVSLTWRGLYPRFFQPHLPPTFAYSARVLLKVIRTVPQPFVSGSPPLPLPDPVTLNVTTLNVDLPSSGQVRSLNTTFTYTLGANSNLIFDHLHAHIILFRRLTLLPQQFTFPIDSKITNDLVLTVSDLASPQPNGVTIP